jgi:hypothetical protein
VTAASLVESVKGDSIQVHLSLLIVTLGLLKRCDGGCLSVDSLAQA